MIFKLNEFFIENLPIEEIGTLTAQSVLGFVFEIVIRVYKIEHILPNTYES